MKIAVTGATGFIGRKVVEHHLAAGDEVRILSRRPAAEIAAAFQPSDAAILNFFQGDLTSDAPLPVEFVEGVDVLYHCAGELARPERMRGLHVDGTRRLIELAAGRIGRWVQLSSVGAYGLRRSGVVDETTPQKPVGEYETTKTEADALVEAAGARGAFDFTILRPTIVFGDDMPNGSLRAWIDAVRRGRFFFVGPSGASANYVHVDNVVRALTTAAVHPAARGRTFIVADGRTVEQFVEGICAASQCRTTRLRIPATVLALVARAAQFLPRSPLTPARVAALTTRVTYAAERIRRELGFETVTSVEAGLRSLVARCVEEERRSAAARPIRLAHVMTSPMSLLFFGGQVGHLRRSGFDVTMVSAPGEMLDEFGRRESVPTHAVPMVRPIAPGSDLVSLLRLRSLLRRLRPDVVHCHTPKAGLLGTIAARGAGVPVVFLSVFGVPQMTRSGLMRRLLDFTTRLSCRLADVVWCDSRSMARYVAEERLCDPAKIRVFGAGSVNGVDTSEAFNPARFDEGARHELLASYGIPPTAPTAIFVGRITRDKGIRELAAAWRTVRERIADAHLLIVGPLDEAHGLSGGDEAALRSDPRIHLAGMRRDVARHLAAADVFVNPSYREGFGIANLEASAMGLPVLSTRIPGCVDSVRDGVTGVLVPSHDAPALADALERYFRDADLRRRHGSAGRERAVREFRPATIWRELEQAYRERLAAARRPKPSRTYLVVKRAVDLAVAVVGLVALAPVLLTTALAVRWTMGGPVLFRQLRPGRGGRPFTMFKFRTMTESAGAAPADDARRLTRLGKFLRSTSLDELPELLNVLRGDMSLVGPRPLLMQYLDRYTPEQSRRHEAKPGITGWAQVNGRNDVDWNERLALDVWYVDHRSLALDVKILLRTIGVVFSRRGVSAAGQATMTEFQGTSSTAGSVSS